MRDDDLDNLRHEAEREALTVALQMLRSPVTPATARASVVRGVLGDAAARRHDEPRNDEDFATMTPAELASARRALEIQIARTNAAPLEFEAVLDKPAASVFD